MLTRRHLPLLGIAGLLAATTAACTPAPEPTLGLQRDGSGYAVVVPLCPKGSVNTVSVSTKIDGRLLSWDVHSGPTPDRTDRFPLFTTPTGWTARESTLTALAPDTTYYVYAYAQENTKDSDLSFTLADLQSLPDDEVLTLKGAHVKAPKFRSTALKLC
ncbi:hypothetical protein [Kitasatospora sp. NPDC101183]|uniref:hypothetical protein n=1 Tax=Kitasatospora sp. NPDC101183 TaxID=3364100 RepID=UPI003810B361